MRLMRGKFTVSFFFNDTATTEIYTLSLHDALPISPASVPSSVSISPEIWATPAPSTTGSHARSEEHTSELQSPCNLVCRLLLEKKKKKIKKIKALRKYMLERMRHM